jgi:hypothetical protein
MTTDEGLPEAASRRRAETQRERRRKWKRIDYAPGDVAWQVIRAWLAEHPGRSIVEGLDALITRAN